MNLDYVESLLETYVIENGGYLYLKITYFKQSAAKPHMRKVQRLSKA